MEQEKLISKFRMLNNSAANSVAERLVTLSKDALEDDPDNPEICSSSLESFYRFLESNHDIVIPEISLTPDHYIYGSWNYGNGKVFSAHFVSGEYVGFVVFKPIFGHPKKIERYSGYTRIENILEIAKSYGVLDWIVKEKE